MVWKPKKVYEFLTVTLGPVWLGPIQINREMISKDQGNTYESIEKQVLLGTYFFVSNDRMIISRSAFTVLDLFSKAGGLFSIMYIVLGAIGKQINCNVIINSVINNLYYESHANSECLKNPKVSICFKDYFCSYKKVKKLRERAHEDLDIINIIHTICKLKAGLSAVIGNDIQKIDIAKNLYFH